MFLTAAWPLGVIISIIQFCRDESALMTLALLGDGQGTARRMISASEAVGRSV